MADVLEREPCPHRIIDDTGSAFALGCIGGSVFHAFKGARNSARNERMLGAILAVKGNARRLGGSFAMWGGFFSVFDCSFSAIRGREDPFNSIASGFCTGAMLAIRGGAQAAMVSGAFGGVILAVIEGLNIAMTKYFAKMPAPEPIQMEGAGDPADQPWYIRWMMPAAPEQKDVDFSDPKELGGSVSLGETRQMASVLEPQIFRGALWANVPWNLVNPHNYARIGSTTDIATGCCQ